MPQISPLLNCFIFIAVVVVTVDVFDAVVVIVGVIVATAAAFEKLDGELGVIKSLGKIGGGV